ncbi:MAG TPA: hypothetical protein VLD37_00935 [Candidatus Bilamarchaeum sp.]|nr:hypothetical protein [Candidatus Bilamarchaeum sp.]
MLAHNPRLRRIELAHPEFASCSDIERLKGVVRYEMMRSGSSRGVLRVLTEGPVKEDEFRVEAKFPAGRGELVFLGFNLPSRLPSEQTLHDETLYLAKVLCSARRPLPENLDIVRLQADQRTALDLEFLYSQTYSDYPVPLNSGVLLSRLRDSIAYGVFSKGRMVSALFGQTCHYGGIPVVEFTLSASIPSIRGIGMTTALAAKIRAEALERDGSSITLAETIAAPVMRSCHDLGMMPHGVLREHYSMTIGNKTYTNLYVWSL